MAKQVIKLGLEFDTKSAIASYRDLVSELSKGGADPKAIKQFTAAIEKAETELAQLAAEGSTGFTDSKGIEQYQKKVLKTVTSMQQLALRMQEFSKSGDNFPTSEVKKLKAEIEKLKKEITDAQKAAKEGLIKSLTTNGGFSKKDAEIIAETVKTEEQLIAKLEEEKKLRDEIRKAAQPAAEKATNAIKDKAVARATSGSQIVMDSVGMKGRKGVKAIREAVATSLQEGIKEGWKAEDIKKNALDAMKQAGISEKLAKEFEASFDLKAIEKELKRVNDDIAKSSAVKKYNEANKSYNQVASGSTENYSQFITKSKEAEKAQQDLAAAENQVSQAALNSVNAQKKNADSAGQQATKAEQAANSFMQMSDAQKENLKSTEALEGGFNRLADRLKYMFGFTAMFNRFRQIIRSTFNDIQQLDKAYASIAYVTNETVGSLWQTYDDYAGMAEKLGQSTTDVIKASAIYRQQGLDTAEALKLTTDTMKLATIAGNDYSTATQEMTAALRGFKMEMDEGSHVSDVYSELAAHAAASVDDIAQAMSRTASIANSAGMSFENTSAFLTQMIETTQESAENIGTSMKTIIARFTELKENVAGTTDSDFEDLNFNKVDEALKSVGVALKDTKGQFRDLDDVFLELSSKWDTLDRNTQRYIATVAAGSRQQSRFIALMDNYDRTIELIDTVADSEGKADEQFAKAADTVEFKLNAVKTKWEEFKLSIMNSDFVKGLLDKVSSVMDLLKNVKMPQVAIVAPFAIQAAKTFALNFIKGFKQSATTLKQIGSVISNSFKKVKPPKINIEITLSEEKIKSFERQIEILNQTISEDSVAVENNKRAIQNYESQIDILKAELVELKQDETANAGAIADAEAKIEELNSQLANENSNLERNQKYLKEDAQARDQLNMKIEAERKQIEFLNAKSQTGSKLTSAAVSSLTMGISGLISGTMTLGQSIKTITFSFASAAAQILINNTLLEINAILTKAAAAGNGKLTLSNIKLAASNMSVATSLFLIVAGIAAIVAIGIGLGKLFGMIFDKGSKAAEAEQHLAEAQERLNEATDNAKSKNSENKSTQKELKDVKELREEYNKLTDGHRLTIEEEEKYNDLVDQIKDKFPEIIAGYDTITGRLKVHNDLWDSIIDRQEESVKLANKETLAANTQVITARENKLAAENEKYDANHMTPEQLEALQHAETSDRWKVGLGAGATGAAAGAGIGAIIGSVVPIAGNAIGAGLGAAIGGAVGLISGAITGAVSIDQYITDEQLETYGKLLEVDAHTEEGRKAILEDMKNASSDTYKKYIKLLDKQEEEHKQYIEEQWKLIEQEKALQYGEAYKNMHLQGENGEEINDASAAFLGRVAAKMPEGYIGTKSNLGNINASNRGYLANQLHGGVKGDNVDWSNETFTGDNFSSWEKVDPKIKGYIEAGGMTEEDYDKYSKDASGQEKIYQAYLAGITAEAVENYGVDVAKQLSQKEQEQVAKYSSNYGSMTLAEINNFSNQFDGNGNFRNVANEMEQDWIKQRNDLIQGDNGLVNLLSEDEKEFENWTLDELQTYSNFVKDQIAIGGEGNQQAVEKYIQNMHNYFQRNGFTKDEEIQMMGSIDFSQANALNWEQFRQNAITTIQDTKNYSEEQAKDMFDNWAESARDARILDTTKASAIEINQEAENFVKITEALKDESETLGKYMTSNLSKETISSVDEYDKIKKSLEELEKAGATGATKLLTWNTVTNKGILDTDKLQKLVNTDLAEQVKHQKAVAATQKVILQNKIKEYEEKTELTTEEQEELETLEAELMEQEAIIDAADQHLNEINAAIAATEELYRNYSQVAIAIDRITNKLSKVTSIGSQLSSDGFLNTSSIEALKEIADKEGKNLRDYFNSAGTLDIDTMYATLKQDAEEQIAKASNDYEKLLATAAYNEIVNAQAEHDEEAKKKTDDKTKALEDLAKAQQDVIDKQKALNEAIDDYNKLLYGSDNRKSTLDPLYNYQQAISYLNDEISRTKEILEDSKGFDEASENLNKYLSAAHYQLIQYQAENKVLEEGLAIRRNNLLNGSVSYQGINVKFGDYVKIDEKTGLASIDQQLIQNAKIADKWKDQIESFVDDYNKYSQELLKNQDAVRKAEKEIQQLRMDATKKWADFEKSIAETLKNEYQEEVDALKEKYNSMKDADDDYVNALEEAINKQRKLRDRENQWEQLAQKEKKLSLLRRDTSGANTLATKKLEKEIEQDREKMLDDKIDDVIENIQKLSEKQDELRQTEIELKEALLDDALYWNMTAETVAQSFTSVDEFLSWSVKHNKEYLEMTEQQRQEFLDSETKKFNESIGAMAILTRDEIDSIENQIEVTAEEINTTVQNTGEVFTTEVSRVINETSAELNKEIADAQNKIQSAIQALVDANEKLREASQKVDEIAAKLAGLSYSGGSYTAATGVTSPSFIDYSNTSANYAEQVGTGQTVGQHEIEQRKIESAFNNFKNLIASNRGTGNYLKSIQGDYAIVSTPGLMGAELEELAKLITSNYKSFSNHILVDTQSDDLKIYKNGVPLDPFYTWNPKFKIYKNGGLVNYTGPAWVDGTSNTPEAFLSAEDTERIGNAAKLLSNVPALNHSNISTTNSSYGDTNIEINLNIDHISSDVDVDEMLERVKQEIVEVARPIGTNVILQQQV